MGMADIGRDWRLGALDTSLKKEPRVGSEPVLDPPSLNIAHSISDGPECSDKYEIPYPTNLISGSSLMKMEELYCFYYCCI